MQVPNITLRRYKMEDYTEEKLSYEQRGDLIKSLCEKKQAEHDDLIELDMEKELEA